MTKVALAFFCATATGLLSISSMAADAQTPGTPRSSLAPPVNHEVGRIEQVVTATDDGYRFRSYVLTWRSMRVVVAGDPEQSFVSGDNLDLLVYRSEVNGRRVLGFATSSSAPGENVADPDSTGSSASITMGTAAIQDVVSADSDGYRFEGYFVDWHDKRIFVVDPQSAPAHAIGETINFRVLRTGLGATGRLSFSL